MTTVTIATTETSVTVSTGDIVLVESVAINLVEVGIQGPTGATGTTDHTALANVGTRTHAQLETDIAARASLGANVFTGNQDFGDKNLLQIKVPSFTGEVSNTTTTGAVTIDWTLGAKQKISEPTGAITFTFTPPPYAACMLQLRIESDGSHAAFTHVFPASVNWYGATWGQEANKGAILSFWWDGTTYHAQGSNKV